MQTIIDLLALLPKTAEEIAAYFRTTECKGQIKASDCCPVATYIIRMTGIQPQIGKTSFSIRSSRCDVPYPPLPIHVQEFISKFDEREYPELIA